MDNKKVILGALVAMMLGACTPTNPTTSTTTHVPTTSFTPWPSTTTQQTTTLVTDINDFNFVLNENGTYDIVSYDNYLPERVVIPEEYNGIKITGILDKAFGGKTSGIKTIVLSKNIEFCSAASFLDSFTIESFEVDSQNEHYIAIDSVLYNKEVSELVFAPRNITTITVPNTVKKILDNGFKGCRAKTIILNDGLEEIGNNAFENTSKLESLKIPNSVTKLGEELLSLSNVYSLEIGTGINELPYHFVNNCDNLNNVVIPGNVKTIGILAFYESQGLYNLTVEEGVETIMYGGFANCGLTNVTLPNSLRSIGGEAFTRNLFLENIVIPEGVEELGDGVFYACGYLETLSLPSTLKTIGASLVAYCNYLNTITLPSTCENFEVVDNVLYSKDKTRLLAFPGDHASFKYVIPEGVTTIDREAFSGVRRLNDLTLPHSLESIGAYCFRETTPLKEVKYNGTVIEWSKVVKSEVYYQLNDDGALEEVDIYWNDLSNVKSLICLDRTIPV